MQFGDLVKTLTRPRNSSSPVQPSTGVLKSILKMAYFSETHYLLHHTIRYWCTRGSVRVEQKVSQTVRYELVVMETMWLQHVWMSSNDQLYTKRHQMFAFMKLVGKW